MSTGLPPGTWLLLFASFALGLTIVLAASMSTVDSLLILASSAVARDFVQKVFRPELTDRRIVSLGKVTTAVIGSAALIFALGEVRVVFWFVLFAWSGLGSFMAPS